MSRKRWILIVGVVIAGIALPALAWSLRDEYQYARIATGYAAKQTCSCLNVSGRTLDSCLADFPAEARGRMDVKQDGASVSASVLLGAIRSEAAFDDGYGCRIVS